MPAFQDRPTSPHIIEPNTDPSPYTSFAKQPPRPPPKDSTAPRAQSPSISQPGAHGPLRSSNSYSALSASATGTARGDTYLRPPSAYSVASAPGSPSYGGQLHQPQAAAYQTSSARSSTLGAPVKGPRRTTSPFADPTPPAGAELADALRDSVIIGADNSHNYLASSPSHAQTSQLIDLDDNNERTFRDDYSRDTKAYQSRGSTDMPSHAYSHSTSGLPNAPSANMAAERERSAPKPRASMQNPFEADEVDPGELATTKTRVKFGRAHTSQTTGPTSPIAGEAAAGSGSGAAPTRTRARRAMSNDTYNPEKDAVTREIIAGQNKAREDKKGSKHADVIDQWDLTGLGKAMWHHSGPYDAAAPSRNVNAPATRAPMSAFRRPGEARPTTSPNKAAGSVGPGTGPEVPEKETAPKEVEHKRIPVQRSGSSRAGGGLTGQYSSSVPSGGAYFPEVDEPTNEADIARMERLREKEMKRRALKAAWGVDEPEPFEDFGFSPNEGPIEYNLSPETRNAALPAAGKPARSPGLRLGLGSSTPPIQEGSASPTGAYFATDALGGSGSATAAANKPAGVKRTKSLMQRIKTMREPKNAPFRSSSPSKAVHPSSPTSEYPFPGGSGSSSKDTSAQASPSRKEQQREQTAGAGNTVKLVAPSYPHDEGYQFADADEIPAASLNDDFVFADSPTKVSGGSTNGQAGQSGLGHHRKKSSYSPLADAPPVPSLPATYGASRSYTKDGERADRTDRLERADKAERGERDAHRASMSRVKNLPAPPVAQVIPDFDDIMGPRGFASTGGQGGPRSANRDPRDVDAIVEEDVPEIYDEKPVREKPGMRRKPSMVKKIKDRIVK